MAQQQQLCLSDAATADVILRLLSSTDEPVTLHLHSQALRRSQFFEARFSERWNPDDKQPVEVTLSDRKNIAACTRCIELMYVPTVEPTFFTSVRDALEALEIAAELLFHDCVNACLCYLEGVQWSADDETLIRLSLATLDAKIPVDLSDRLFSSGCDPMKMMEDLLTEMVSRVSLTSFDSSSRIRTYIETLLRKNVHPAVPAVFGSVNKAIFYKEWNRNLDLIKTKQSSPDFNEGFDMAGKLEWFLQTILSLKIGVDAVKVLAQEDTAKLLVDYFARSCRLEPANMVILIMRAFKSGELIISRPIRLALVKTWLPLMYNIHNIELLVNDWQEGFRALIKTLPLADQSEIFTIWFSTCSGTTRPACLALPWPNLEEVFELYCDELRHRTLTRKLVHFWSSTE